MKTKKPFDIKERTFLFGIEIVHSCRIMQKMEQEYVLSKQLLRSGTAIGALIREAHNGESHADFIHKMAIAQKECAETIYWLDLIYATDLNNESKVLLLKSEAEELLKIIRTIILNKKRSLSK